MTAAAFGTLFPSVGCEGPPQCTEDPSNLTPETTAACEKLTVSADPRIVSAGAEHLGDRTLVLTWTSLGLECGVRAENVEIGGNCNRTGWVYTVELPPPLAAIGLIDVAAHPEIRGALAVMQEGLSGVMETIGDEPFFVGQLELTQISEGCVSGVLHSFVPRESESINVPTLSGGFVAPTC